MKHVGVKPTHELFKVDDYVYMELFPDGMKKYWNVKTLNTGCGNVLENVVRDGDLIYCPYCDEMANKNQFEEIKDD